MKHALFFFFASAAAIAVGCHVSTVTVSASADAGAEDASTSADSGTEDASDGSTLSPACAAQATALQGALDTARKGQNSPGAILAVTTPACGPWVGASGTSTTGVPLDPTDVVRVGSVTKTFVATTILRLNAAGSLHLTDSLEQWLPGFPNGTSITITELLNHSSGIFDYTADTTWAATEQQTPSTVWTPQQLVDVAASHAATFAPGTSWAYSNTNYILLGQIIEKITGGPVGAALHANAIDRASLSFTSFPGFEPIKGTLAHGFSTSGADVSTTFDSSYAWTAGAMVASGADLVTWATSLYAGDVLDAASQSLMMQTIPTGESGVSYGLGVIVLDASLTGGLGKGVGHDGDIDGYHTQMFYFPDKKTAVIAVVTKDGADPNAISAAAFTALGY